MAWKYRSVREYVAAKGEGDAARADQILREVCRRFVAYEADGAEVTELGRAANQIYPDQS